MLKFFRIITKAFVFVVALVAILVTFGMGAWFVLTQSSGSVEIPSIGLAPGGQPSSPEDYLIGFYLQFRRGDVTRPASDDSTPITFTVEPGETATIVAARLAEMGLIADSELFRLFLRYHNLDQSLEAGNYELRRNMTMVEIAEALQHARLEEVTVSIPEGWRAEQVAELLGRENIMDGSTFMAFVQGGGASLPDAPYSILDEIPPGASLEGFLYPDTYRVPERATPADLVTRMLANMEGEVTPELRAQSADQGLTFYQVLIVASIVEREAVIAEERPLIASVYLNRVQGNMFLGADPTVQYAMGFQPDSGQWWKTPVTLEEYENVISPYNTYLNRGLPPGPICSPGLESIKAVLEPADTDYIYFVARGDGYHVFAETSEEHEQNVLKYQGGGQ
jgi:UPF0755 protein